MVWGSVLAHDGSDHVSQLEQWVAGGGIVLILIALIYRLLSDWLNRNKDAEQDYRSNDV